MPLWVGVGVDVDVLVLLGEAVVVVPDTPIYEESFGQYTSCRETGERLKATYAVIVSSKELGITVLSARAEDWVPSIELRCRDTVVAGKFAAVVA